MLNRLKFILITALPSLLFFFFLIPNADAASTYTIYAYGSGYIMTGILQSIASVVASGGFSLILKSVVLVGFVIIFLQMIITSFKVSPHRSLLKYFSAVLVIYSALLIPKVNVNVYDTVNNTGSSAVVVSNVPWGIGAIASYFSEFQYYMTTNIEQAFSTPQTIDLTNAGMGFALTSQNIVDGVQIDDPYLFQSFTQYVYNCVLPGISAGGLSSQALTQAGMSTTGTGNATNTLLGYMASYTGGAGANLLTTEYSAVGGDGSPSGTTTTCGAQTLDIQTDFTNYANNEAGPQIAGALGMTYATFASQYGLVNSAIYNMSSNAEDEIIQMMAVNQYSQAMIQSANLAGVNPSQLAYGSALAQQNMSDSFSISGQMAGRYMPVVYGIFSALFLAFSLFLIILMALPIGVNYLKMYMELGLFLAVWPTLMAVYNYIMDLVIQQGFLSYAAQGYSLNSAHTINTFIATQLGWMGYLSWSVPIMAYALVTGSTYAMVGAISSMDSAGKQASSAAASQAASGNVNLGNDSLRNYSAANKSMDNLGAMDVSTGNTSRNNRSIGNINKNGLSEIVDGSVINGKSTNPNEVSSIMSQNGLTESQKADELAKSGSFTGSITGQSREGLSTYNIANGVATEQSTANGFNTSQVITKGVGGKTVAGTAIKKGIGKPGQLISLNTGSSKTYTENLNAAEAKKIGLPGAGAYTFSKTANGQEVAVRGSNGAVVSGLTKNGYAGTTTSVLNPKTDKYTPIYTSGNKGIKFNKDNIKNSSTERFGLNRFGHLGQYYKETQYRSGVNSINDNSATKKAGTFYQSPEYSANQAFLSDGSYMNNYARYSPGGAGIVSGMKAKDTGAFGTFINQTQDMMQKYGGNTNQLVFSAKVTDEIEASGGLKILGTGVQDKFKASVGVDGQTMMSTNALYTETGNQLTHYGNEYKNGKISWSQYQNNVNGLVSEYKNIIKIGSAPSASAFLGKQENNGKIGVMPNGKNFMGNNGNMDSM